MGLTSNDVVEDTSNAMPQARPAGRHQPFEIPARPFWVGFAGIVAIAAVAVGLFGRRVFLWSDDYVFLFDAQGRSLGWDQLKIALFGHFSPVSQFTDVLVAAHLPTQPWLIRTILLLLSVSVVAAVAFLMVSLFGRTWLTLIGTALAAPSLGLLPLVNWWTAGLNIMPAMIGVALSLGAIVRMVRGGAAWWGMLAIGGYLLSVMSWELGITAVGYAAVWTVLFGSRVSSQSWRELVRRTWWVWAVLAVIALWSVANYRFNYYNPTPAPPGGLALEALATSLFTMQLPLTLGLYDPSRPWFELLGIGLGGFAFVTLIVVTLLRSRRAWRGWSFALIGWLIPVAAVVLSRVGYIGVRAIEQPMYYYLPTLLFLVGVLEAWAAPWRLQHDGVDAAPVRAPRRSTLLAGAVTAVALGLAWLSSAWPTISSTNYGTIGSPNAPERDFMANLVNSAHALQGSGELFSVINGVAPGGLLNFQGHNRLSQMTSVHDPSIRFDAPDGPWYAPDATGTLIPATPQWRSELWLISPFTELMTSGITATNAGPGFCFTVDAPAASLRWDLPAPVAGGPLVIRTMATAQEATPVRVSTVTNAGDAPVATNVNPRPWTVDGSGRLDTTPEPQISSVVIDSMAVGTSMCVTSVQVGTVSTS